MPISWRIEAVEKVHPSRIRYIGLRQKNEIGAKSKSGVYEAVAEERPYLP